MGIIPNFQRENTKTIETTTYEYRNHRLGYTVIPSSQNHHSPQHLVVWMLGGENSKPCSTARGSKVVGPIKHEE